MKLPLLTSKLLPVPHGFTTREGGVSQGVYESLNLGFSVGDERERVEENLRRAAHAGGMEPAQLHTVSQVHGAVVHHSLPSLGVAAGKLLEPEAKADALWTASRGHGVGVKTADCVPLLLVDPIGQRVAAVHSGWRGTDARIAARAVEALVREGADPGSLLAAIGPAIGPCCYEVSEELGTRFELAFGPEVVDRNRGAPRLNLWLCVRTTLKQVGLRDERIDEVPLCTACDERRFFSHRRSQGRTGRHLSFVVCRF